MIVKYRSVLEKVDKAIADNESSELEIEHIQLSSREWARFIYELDRIAPRYDMLIRPPSDSVTYHGVTVFRETEKVEEVKS